MNIRSISVAIFCLCFLTACDKQGHSVTQKAAIGQSQPMELQATQKELTETHARLEAQRDDQLSKIKILNREISELEIRNEELANELKQLDEVRNLMN